jgi:hypothetical protein
MSKPRTECIFASALGMGYTDAEAARLEFLICEEIGRAGLQDRRSVCQRATRPGRVRRCVGL